MAASDPDVHDVGVPLLVRPRRTEGVLARGARRALPAAEQVRLAQHAVHGALAGGDNVLVQHRVGQLPVSCLGMAQREGLNGSHFVGQPAVVAGRTPRQVGKRSRLRAGPLGEVDATRYAQTRQNRIQWPLAPSLRGVDQRQDVLFLLRTQASSSCQAESFFQLQILFRDLGDDATHPLELGLQSYGMSVGLAIAAAVDLLLGLGGGLLRHGAPAIHQTRADAVLPADLRQRDAGLLRFVENRALLVRGELSVASLVHQLNSSPSILCARPAPSL